jgi:hypothetical protein
MGLVNQSLKDFWSAFLGVSAAASGSENSDRIFNPSLFSKDSTDMLHCLNDWLDNFRTQQ